MSCTKRGGGDEFEFERVGESVREGAAKAGDGRRAGECEGE